MCEHLPGVSRQSTEPAGSSSFTVPGGVNPQHGIADWVELVATERQARALEPPAAMDCPLSQSPHNAWQ